MKKVYFVTTARNILIKYLECIGVVYDVIQSNIWFDDYVVSATLTNIQIEFAYDLITNHDYLASCYDQEEYDDFLRLATTKRSMTIM